MDDKKRRITDEELKDALEKSGGVMAEAARLIEEATGQPYSRQAVFDRVKKSPVLREAVQSGRDSLVDIAESELLKMLKAGNEKAVFFVLETRGKYRGFNKNGGFTSDMKQIAQANLSLDELLNAGLD